MRLLVMVTFSSVTSSPCPRAWVGSWSVLTPIGGQSVPVFVFFFFAFESAHGHCPGRSVPVVHFCLEVCQGLVPGQANMQNRFAMICCHRRIPFGGIRLPSTTGVAAHQSQPSLGCCPSVLTRGQGECRPLQYRRPHCAMSLSITPAHLESLSKVAPLGPSADLHWSSVVFGLGCSMSLSRFAHGRAHPCVRPSVDVSIFLLCVRTRTRAMMFIPWWKQK